MRLAAQALAALAAPALVCGALPPSGEPIAAPGPDGWAPIARTASVSATPRGTADVFGNGPHDLFITMREVYPYEGLGPDGAPRYGTPVSASSPSSNGYVFTDASGDVQGVFWSGETLSLRDFNTSTRSFGSATSRTLSLPSSIQFAAGTETATGVFNAYLRLDDGTSYQPIGPPNDWPSYRPYDGAGIWRGGFPGDYLMHARFTSIGLPSPQIVTQPFGDDAMFLFNNGNLTVVNLGPGREADVISSEKHGLLRYFRVSNVLSGAPAEPVNVRTTGGAALIHPVINSIVAPFTNPDTGLSDLIVGDTCRTWHYRFTGDFAADGAPIYDGPKAVLRRDGHIPLGALPVISAGDVDGDGDVDLIAGNDAGEVLYLENQGDSSTPEFALPVPLPVDGGPVKIRAGYRGSLQGPAEVAWGYSCPTLADWNGDGLLDVVMSSILADYVVLLQKNSAELEFERPHPIYCDGLDLHLTWRQQPAVTDWGEPGRLDLVTFDEKDRLATFHRIDAYNVERGPLLRLPSGDPITANYRAAGQTGRTKLQAVDWDGDGDIDLLAGVRRAHSIPRPEDGVPNSYGDGDREATVLFLENVGTNAAPVFAEPVRVLFQNDMIRLDIHSCSPAAVDLGRGSLDLLVAEENGSILYFAREDLTP